MPFKEHYRCIPPHMYDDVRAHIQEMLDIDAFQAHQCPCYIPEANGDLNLHWCIIYLDDIVIFSKDLASHLDRLEAVFWKLEKAVLKLKPSKCELFWRQLAYLGHVISAKGVATDEGKIEAIKNWSTPKTVMEVRSCFWI